MDFPADMKVNGEFFFHITARTGPIDLHLALLDYYGRNASVRNVVFNAEKLDIDPTEFSSKLRQAKVSKLSRLLLVDGGGDITEIALDS